MNTPTNLYKDVFVGACFTAGILGFLSGEFIISTLLFGMASLSSNLDFGTPVRT